MEGPALDPADLLGPDGEDWRVPVTELETRQRELARRLREAGLPGILLGFFSAINLKPVYPAAAPAFGAILDFMMRQGGFAEFAGVCL